MNQIPIGGLSAVAEAEKPTRRAQAKRRTREKIVGAAKSLFAERGYESATIRDIAKAAGMSTGAVFASFTDKADLFTEIAEAEQAELHQTMQLAAAGLSDRVFITNTVFWRPPGNRTPLPAEQAVCAPFLERAIALVRPKALLLAGGASAKAMLKQREGILALRGRWFTWRGEDPDLQIPTLPTLPPAFLLRQPAAKRKSWEDLLLLSARLDRPDRPA